jgi:hypothetical protein
MSELAAVREILGGVLSQNILIEHLVRAEGPRPWIPDKRKHKIRLPDICRYALYTSKLVFGAGVETFLAQIRDSSQDGC